MVSALGAVVGGVIGLASLIVDPVKVPIGVKVLTAGPMHDQRSMGTEQHALILASSMKAACSLAR